MKNLPDWLQRKAKSSLWGHPAWHVQQGSHKLGLAGKTPEGKGLALRSGQGRSQPAPGASPTLVQTLENGSPNSAWA